MNEMFNRVFETIYRVSVLGCLYFIVNVLLFFPLLNTRKLNFLEGLGIFGYFLIVLLFPSTVTLIAVTKDYINDTTMKMSKFFWEKYKTYFLPSFLTGIIMIMVIYVCGVYIKFLISMNASIFLVAVYIFALILVALLLIQIPQVIIHNEKNPLYILIKSLNLLYQHIGLKIVMLVSVVFGMLLFNFIPISLFITPVAIAYIGSYSCCGVNLPIAEVDRKRI